MLENFRSVLEKFTFGDAMAIAKEVWLM